MDIKTKAEVIDKQKAKAYLSMRWSNQRNIRQSHVNFLASEMKRGKFSLAKIDFVNLNGNMYLVNGQHTLSAIAKSGIPQEVVVVTQNAHDTRHVSEIFSAIDRGKRRSESDSVMAYGLLEKVNVSKSFLSRAIASVKYADFLGFGEYKSTPSPIPIDLLFDRVVMYGSAIESCGEVIDAMPSELTRLYLKRPVLSVMIALFHYYKNKSKVYDFWHGVTNGIAIAPPNGYYDPRTLLGATINTVYVRSTANRDKKSKPEEYFSRLCSVAWNAFSSGRHMKNKKLSVRSHNGSYRYPLKLNGTIYRGKPIKSIQIYWWPALKNKG